MCGLKVEIFNAKFWWCVYSPLPLKMLRKESGVIGTNDG